MLIALSTTLDWDKLAQKALNTNKQEDANEKTETDLKTERKRKQKKNENTG